MDRVRILFDHLQKTGGTAWSKFLSTSFPNLVSSPLILHERVDFCHKLFDEFDFVSAHIDLIPGYTWPRDVIHVTMLRDPINRFLSHYSYVRETEEANEPFAQLAKIYSIDELIERKDLVFLETIQTFYINHYAQGLSPEGHSYSINELAEFISDRYTFILLTENMEVFTRFFCDRYLTAANTPIPVERRTEHRIRENDLSVGTLKKLIQLAEADRELYWRVAQRAHQILYKDTKNEFLPASYDVRNQATQHSSLAESAEKTVEIRAVELSCLSLDLTDLAEQGSWCTLNLLMKFMAPFRNGIVHAVFRNAVHAVAYRDSFPIDGFGTAEVTEAEFSWRFLCSLGEGLYDCDFDVKLFDQNGLQYEDTRFRSAYQFSVLSRKGSTAAGSCYLVPQFHTVSRHGPPELAATIELPDRHFTALPDELMLIPVTAVNRGNNTWPVSGINRVNLSYWLWGPEIDQTHADAPRQPLTKQVAGGSTLDMDIVIKAPKITGRYSINVGLVQERVAWLFLSESPIILDVVDAPPGSTPIA